MPVSVFTADGLLPPGRHVATVVDVEQALVEPFPESTRRSLFASWRARRDALLALLPVVEWVDGSFVGAKPVPADIDLVTILSVEDHDGLTVTDRDALYRLVDNAHCREEFGCDVYPLVTFPDGHPDHAGAVAMRDYWADWWGHDRDRRAKGYLEVR